MIVTIVAARHTPAAISGKAFLKGILKTNEAREPVHAPVIGSGIPTNTTSAMAPYLAYRPENFFSARSKR